MSQRVTNEGAGRTATEVAGLSLRNPVMLAAGTAGTLDEMGDVLDLSRVGGVVTKSITRLPREGNNTWRILPSDVGMLNAIGLANVGLDGFMASYGPRVGAMPCAVIGSVAGYSIDDYVSVAGAMDGLGTLGGIELNVSCPNVHNGCEFGLDAQLLGDLVREVRAVVRGTRLFVKLSPVAVGRPGIVELARAAVDPPNSAPQGPNQRPGADALCLTNTMPALAIDVESRRPTLANVTGGLSGPAIHPISLKIVHDVYRNFAKAAGVPLVGIGGVTRWEHAAEFILAGASAVEMGTALFADPRAPLKVVAGLESWVKRQRAASIMELIGGLRL